MIRNARVEDWPQVVELGLRLLEKTPYRDVRLDREQSLHTYSLCMNSALGFAKVATRNGDITGLLLGVADRLWWSKSRYASDLVFYCEDGRSGLSLLTAFVEWAWTVPGVVEVTCAQSSAIRTEETAKLYQRVGFRQMGGLWTRVKK